MVVLAIVDYVKKNPRATEDQLAKFIQEQIVLFQTALQALWNLPMIEPANGLDFSMFIEDSAALLCCGIR